MRTIGATLARVSRTIRVHLAVLGTALNRAVKHRILTVTPLWLVDLPSPGPSAAKHWDAEQVRLFLGAAKRSYLHSLFIVAVATGLRSCEVRALREEDYDPPFLHVRQKVRRVRGNWIFEEVQKTKHSRRTVMLPAFAQAALSRQLTGQIPPAIPRKPYKIASCVSALKTCIFFISMTTSVLCPIRAWLRAPTRATMLCSPAVR